MSRLKEQYENEIVPALVKKFDYKNPMEVPKLVKIVVNMGVGEAKENVKLLDAAVADMETITGQHVVRTKAKKSIANFKLREGMPIGCKVTLRGDKMYDFLREYNYRLKSNELKPHFDSIHEQAKDTIHY